MEAFGRLAQRYERSLMSIALMKLRNFHEAQDVVQAPLLRAFHRFETLRDAAKFGPWLIQIARSQVAESARTRLFRATSDIAPSSSPVCERWQAEAGFDDEQLLVMVDRLPEHERVLVGLRYFDGHSMAEIAAMLERPVGTVTKQISRAISRLRTWYTEETHNEP
ncbi:MAG: sigma-70 family RNA polymerase sigma factor [Planctomycetaceae bacterium]